jgi:hypothetical protein
MTARVACPCVAVGLWKKKNIKKIIWRKTIVSYNVFKKKNYKTKFSISLILKKKLTNNFEKNHKKKIMWEMTVAIHSVLKKKKSTNLNSQPAQY